jgi:hypothetical protein
MVVYTAAGAEATKTSRITTTQQAANTITFFFTQSAKCELFMGKRLSTVLNSHSSQMSPPVDEEGNPTYSK